VAKERFYKFSHLDVQETPLKIRFGRFLIQKNVNEPNHFHGYFQLCFIVTQNFSLQPIHRP